MPIAYLAGALKHQVAVSDEYKYSLIIAFGLLLQSIEIYLKLNNYWRQFLAEDVVTKCLPGICSAFFISICLHQGKHEYSFMYFEYWLTSCSRLGVIFSAVLAFASTSAYSGLCYYVLKHLPRSFTYGEATIVLQGSVLFLVNVFLKLPTMINYHPLSNMARMSTILQVSAAISIVSEGLTYTYTCITFFSCRSVYLVSHALLAAAILCEPSVVHYSTPFLPS